MVCGALLAALPIASSAFAATYACYPVDVTGKCLGPTDDIIRVEAVDIKNLGNGEVEIDVTLRNVLAQSVPEAWYILQVRDEDGRNVYLQLDIREIADGASDLVVNHVLLENGNYTIKVMVYTGLDDVPEPLLYSPTERPLNLSA